jgi:hypothetical protein
MTRDRRWFSSLTPVMTKDYITFGDVTPAFLAPNKSPNKSRVFSKLSRLAHFNPFRNPGRFFSPRRACRESRRPVRLAITAIPELTPVSEKPRKIRKTPSPNFPRNSPNFLNPFSIFFPYFPFFLFSFFVFFSLFSFFFFPFFPTVLLPSVEHQTATPPPGVTPTPLVLQDQRPSLLWPCLASSLAGAARQGRPRSPPGRVAPLHCSDR